MLFKRIIASLVAASAITTGAFAFTPYGQVSAPEKDTDSQQTEANKNVVQSFNPKEYQYMLFEQILDAYVEKHLYDFTEEEVLHKFFRDFLNDNPMYFNYFTEYLLGTMDPYSAYYDASSNFLEPDKGATGFGFIINDNEDGVYIKEVIKGSNAEDAGFAAGDRFISVAGITVENQTIDIVSAVLANAKRFMEQAAEVSDASADQALPADIPVEIIVDRNGEKITFNISKGPMTVSQLSHTITDNNGKPTAIIQLTSFLGDGTDEQFVNLIRKLEADGIKHITIDLRDNGGGSLDYALAMAETFLEEGEIISYFKDKKQDKPEAVYSTTPKASFDSITVLINENTASAAELFTSILKDKGLAKVIGTKSFGKSLGQEVFTLANGDYITITTYQMLNESLESYDGIGIYPDLAIEDVEMCYTLPPLGIFNHQNAAEIKEGEYSDVAKALEDRMFIMGLLRQKYCDGIFDETTKTALYILQKEHSLEATGYVSYETVSLITKIINSYKAHTYYDDAQMDVALIVHHSFSQGKRLVNEKERLRKEQKELIDERDAALEAAYDAAHPETNKENN